MVLFLGWMTLLSSISYGETPETWRVCAAASDCVVIATYCGGWASIHKKMIKDARAHYDKMSAIKECPKVNVPKPLPECLQGHCEPEHVWR